MGSHLPPKAPGSSQLWGHLSPMVPSVLSEQHPRRLCLLRLADWSLAGSVRKKWESFKCRLSICSMWNMHVCVFPLTTHIQQGKAFKTRTWNKSCVTHSPATPSCTLTRNHRQSSIRCYTPSALIAASDPKGKPTLCIYNHTSWAKSISINSTFTSKWALLHHHTKVWFCWLLWVFWYETSERTSSLWCAKHRPGCLRGLRRDT